MAHAGNPNHGKDGKFSSGHNAGNGNRVVASHVAKQHKSSQASGGPSKKDISYARANPTDAVLEDYANRFGDKAIKKLKLNRK